jgi:hypothetical protein
MVPPQPSATLPQFIPAGHVVVVFVQLVAPHWFGAATPQTSPARHFPDPQSITPPQPSETRPHSFAPHEAGVRATHPPGGPPDPQTLGVPPPPQVWGATQAAPQLAVTPPQPSGCGPHLPGKSVHVFFVQAPPPATAHLLGPPPPQNSGAWHPPQSIVPPQPSLCVPQSMF